MKRLVCKHKEPDGKQCTATALKSTGYCPDHTYLYEQGREAFERQGGEKKK